MVNVDGVVHGNSRCTLAGVDPNRVWCQSEFFEGFVFFRDLHFVIFCVSCEKCKIRIFFFEA